jgi:hypothetical protein
LELNDVNPFTKIPESKKYWLIRTNGGRYYNEYKRDGFIAINWDSISIGDIETMSPEELALQVKLEYPDKPGHKRTANQLRIFSNLLKTGDTVIITGYSSNKLTIGEIAEDQPFSVIVNEKLIEENPNVCPYQKRKRVIWGPTYHKFDIDIELYKMLQHAQHTISSADDYADAIEGLTRNYFLRGNTAYLALRVRKNGKIPMSEFFPMGTEILKIAQEFNEFSSLVKLDISDIETKINVNSPGKIKFLGTAITITAIGLILVGLIGGKFSIKTPEKYGSLDLELSTPGLIQEVNKFIKARKETGLKEQILEQYMDGLEIETPDELKGLLEAVSSVSE